MTVTMVPATAWVQQYGEMSGLSRASLDRPLASHPGTMITETHGDRLLRGRDTFVPAGVFGSTRLAR